MKKVEAILELLKAYENYTEFEGQSVNDQNYNALVTDIIKLFAIPIVSVSLPNNEEIGDQAIKALFGFGKGRIGDDDYADGYEDGAKWIRDKCNES